MGDINKAIEAASPHIEAIMSVEVTVSVHTLCVGSVVVWVAVCLYRRMFPGNIYVMGC